MQLCPVWGHLPSVSPPRPVRSLPEPCLQATPGSTRQRAALAERSPNLSQPAKVNGSFSSILRVEADGLEVEESQSVSALLSIQQADTAGASVLDCSAQDGEPDTLHGGLVLGSSFLERPWLPPEDSTMLSGDLDEGDEEMPPPPPPPPPAAFQCGSEPARAEPVPRSRSRSPGVVATLVCEHCEDVVRGQYYEKDGVVVHSECFGEYRKLRRSRRSKKSPPSNRRRSRSDGSARKRTGRSPRPRKEPPPCPSIATPRHPQAHQEATAVPMVDRRTSSSPNTTPPLRAPPPPPPPGCLPQSEVFVARGYSGGEVDSSPVSARHRPPQLQRASLGSSLAEEVAQLFIGDMIDSRLIPRESAEETEWLIRPGEASLLAQQSLASQFSSPTPDAPQAPPQWGLMGQQHMMDTQSLSVSPDVAQPPDHRRYAIPQAPGPLSSICEGQEPSVPRAIRESSLPPQSSPAIPFDTITQPFIPEATSTLHPRASPPMSRVEGTPIVSTGEKRPSTPPSKAISSRPPSPLTPVTNQEMSAIVPVPDEESDLPIQPPTRGVHRPPPIPGSAVHWTASAPLDHISFVSQGVVTESNSPPPAQQTHADRGSQTTGLEPGDNAPFGRQASLSHRGRSESASPPPLPCFNQKTELQDLRREMEGLRSRLKRAEQDATKAQTTAAVMRVLSEESQARMELAAAAAHPPSHWTVQSGRLLRDLAVARVAAASASAAADARLTCTVLPPPAPARQASPAPTPRAGVKLSNAALATLLLTPRSRAGLSRQPSSSMQRCGSRSESPAPLPPQSRSSTPLC
eukprot:Hpha_TRINITY_DN16994_c2_g4::TRINITY_DN16994_c2_g4_i1::g.54889::m.54889